MKNQAAFIYVLKDPRDGCIRYVGKAIDVEKRFKSHLRDMKNDDRSHYPLYRWMLKLQTEGVLPAIEVLDFTTDWVETEPRLIAVLRARGEKLLNIAEGGNAPYCPLEVRQANGRKTAEKIRRDPRAKKLHENKRLLGIALRQGMVSNQVRVKMRDAAIRHPAIFGIWANLPNREEVMC